MRYLLAIVLPPVAVLVVRNEVNRFMPETVQFHRMMLRQPAIADEGR